MRRSQPNLNYPYDICQLAKQKRLPFCRSESHSIQIFDLVHVDIWGTYIAASIHGHKYVHSLVDDFSRFAWIVLMQHKYKTRKHLQNFVV